MILKSRYPWYPVHRLQFAVGERGLGVEWSGSGAQVGGAGLLVGAFGGGAFQLLHVRHDFLLCFTFLTLALGPTAPTRLRFLFATTTPPSTIQTRIPPTPLPTTRAALLDKNLRNFSTIPSAIGMHNNNAKKSSYKKKRKYNKIK